MPTPKPPPNIIKYNESLTPEERSASASRAAKAMVKSRARNRTVGKIVTQYLNEEHDFKDKNTGEYIKMTGAEMLFKQIIATASNPSHRNWAKAMDYILTLSGQDKAPVELAKLKAETALLKAKAELMKGAKPEKSITDDNLLAALKATAADDWTEDEENGTGED